jgi:hypothetical protein
MGARREERVPVTGVFRWSQRVISSLAVHCVRIGWVEPCHKKIHCCLAGSVPSCLVPPRFQDGYIVTAEENDLE